MRKKDLEEIKKRLSKPHKAVLTLHLSPDPDSIGSVLALYHVLKRHNIEADIFTHDPVPEDFLFLPGADVIQEKSAQDIDWESYDTFWALDIAAQERNGKEGDYPDSLDIVNIDHHITNTRYGALNIVMDVPSTASILFDIFNQLEEDIDPHIAQNLMMGLVGDTGFFSYVGTEEVFKMAAELMKAGADYKALKRNLSQNIAYDVAIATGQVLSQLQLIPDQRVLYAVITESHIKELGSSYHAMKGTIARYLQSIKEADWGFIVVEHAPGKSKITLRSRDITKVDVAKIAQKLGGGGHPVAAGAVLPRKPVQDIVVEVLKAAESV